MFVNYVKPSNLLDACLLHSGQKGGTIHEFMPRLRWSSKRTRDNLINWTTNEKHPIFEHILMLDGEHQIAWIESIDSPPAIEPSLLIRFNHVGVPV